MTQRTETPAPATYAVVADGYTWANAPVGFAIQQLVDRERATALVDEMNANAVRLDLDGRWHAEFVY